MPATMDMSSMAHTLESVSTMVLGMERPQSALKLRRVSIYNNCTSIFILSNFRILTDNCGQLYAPQYGKVSVNGYSYSSTAYYSCDYGYELHGSYSRKCQHDGSWYGKAPVCLKAKISKEQLPKM